MKKLDAIRVDDTLREAQQHGSYSFPLQTYLDDLDHYDTGEVSWHWHPEVEFGVMLQGCALVHTGEQELSLTPGQGFFLNANVLHRVRPGLAGTVFFSVLFSPVLVAGHVGSAVGQKYVQPVLACGALKALPLDGATPWQKDLMDRLRAIYDLHLEKGPGHELLVRAELDRAWHLLYGGSRPLLARTAPPAAEKDDARLKQMLRAIHTRYAEPLTLRDIAGAANLSVSECCRCFNRVLGTTPFAYLNRCRLEAAARLLAGGKTTVTQAGALSGFNSPSYFGKQFAALFGCTPRQYRQREAAGDMTESLLSTGHAIL